MPSSSSTSSAWWDQANGSEAFLKIAKKNRWILLSATPGDTWMDYIPVFVANGFYRNRTHFIAEHVIFAPYVKYAKVQRYVNVSTLVQHRNDILVRMRYYRETVRHTKMVFTEYDVDLMETVVKKRWNPYLNKPIRDASELFSLMRRIVNSDPSRLEAVKELLETHDRLVIFYNFNYELEVLRGLGDLVETAEWNGHKHEDLPRSEKMGVFSAVCGGF